MLPASKPGIRRAVQPALWRERRPRGSGPNPGPAGRLKKGGESADTGTRNACREAEPGGTLRAGTQAGRDTGRPGHGTTMSTRKPIMKRLAGAAALALTVLVLASPALLGGCASKGPLNQPPKVDEAALRREAEAKAKREAEERKLAEERRIAEEKRQKEEMMQAFGTVGQPEAPAPPALTKAEAGAVPYDQAVPPLPAEPTVRVVVLSHDAPPEAGRDVALLIGTYERPWIESHTGMAVKILYVAQATQPLSRPSEVHYRNNYLLAAQAVAQSMSAQQWIAPMTPDELHQPDADIVVHIGKDYR
jgi:predicted small lipoprotein YifL